MHQHNQNITKTIKTPQVKNTPTRVKPIQFQPQLNNTHQLNQKRTNQIEYQ